MRHYKNRWAGFGLELPDAPWEVEVTEGFVVVRPFLGSPAHALLWPLRLPGPIPPEAAAAHFIALAHRQNPTLKVWRAPSTTPGSLCLRTRARKDGVELAGVFQVTTNGPSGLLAGFEGPANQLEGLAPAFAQVLESFRPLPLLRRVIFRDPVEGGFTAEIPDGFQARGGMQRDPTYGTAVMNFEAFEPRLLLHCGIPPANFTFTEGGLMGLLGGMMGGGMMGMGGPPALGFMPAPVFAEKWVAPRSRHKGARIERVTDRPDLVPMLAASWAQGGVVAPASLFSAAVLDLVFDGAGTRHRERALVTVARMAGANVWTAAISATITAPLDLWDEWEPVLFGINSSVKTNQAWQQAETARNNSMNQARVQDMHRRQLEISRTLAETSDIVSQGWHQRQAVQDRLHHDFSNVILGRQDMVDSSGSVFNVPAGHDRYWRDGLNNVFAGSWSNNPDPTWSPLDLR